MDKLKLQYKRKCKNQTRKDMGDLIDKSETTYGKKESGEIKFTAEEVVKIAKHLDLTSSEVNEIFFDGNLPNR